MGAVGHVKTAPICALSVAIRKMNICLEDDDAIARNFADDAAAIATPRTDDSRLDEDVARGGLKTGARNDWRKVIGTSVDTVFPNLANCHRAFVDTIDHCP